MLDANNQFDKYKADSNSAKTIIINYKWQEHNKINGSLFYCFDYFLFLKKYNYDCILSIIGISTLDIQKVVDAYQDKYQVKFANQIEENIRYYNSIVRWAAKNDPEYHIQVCFDIFTYLGIKFFIKTNKKFTYINNNYDDVLTKCVSITCDKDENINWFWYYEYQYIQCYNDIRIKTPLRIGFEFQKKCDMGNKTFISTTFGCPENIIPKDEELFILKSYYNIYPNLFDKIHSLIHLHTSLDTNNRIIAEAFYHNKKVTVDNYYTKYDSVAHRYDLGLKGQLNQITLNTDCLMFQKITDYYNN